MELIRNPLVITLADRETIEHSVFVRDGNGPIEHLVHLQVLGSGHAKVIDYDTHPRYRGHPDSPAAVASKVKRFLELDGHKMLGHPNAPATQEAEVARLKTKHKL